ncbi:uncharacterized protein LACBIDRAFT_335532 [Laccaria bicolor S238N-H82]|uniref:Predicted protein n=1 Tax=Laccaria bicolor (strain S238N-H82 / ATCC MYA-4686) TaxID=486041 RepID=B0E2K5_LACBS|nr:uncharacterized protein LACBIDRAFT_335532 [Laccaria bicolor S238N-H82]EDQ98912.1 predicted protein [Laccaria bicolor S238N-H82]|eukprot:XP_001890423.1 predicted protein [Laccaria bicolor S238N-H82]
MLWVLNSFLIMMSQLSSLFILLRNHEITAKDVLNHTDWSLSTLFFCGNRNLQSPLPPLKSAIQKFNLSADVAKIKTAIKEASRLKTEDQKKQALVKIAMDNRLSL